MTPIYSRLSLSKVTLRIDIFLFFYTLLKYYVSNMSLNCESCM